jgi:phage terminase large subunit-like protein
MCRSIVAIVPPVSALITIQAGKVAFPAHLLETRFRDIVFAAPVGDRLGSSELVELDDALNDRRLLADAVVANPEQKQRARQPMLQIADSMCRLVLQIRIDFGKRGKIEPIPHTAKSPRQ